MAPVTITVAMGYWKCPEYVERAVRSVLAQTVPDLHVVVIGDGEEPPLGNVRDSRLDVYTLPRNRGAYFALQLALLASGHRWFAPFGADDRAEPDHLERLLAVQRRSRSDAVTTGAVFKNDGTVHKGQYEVGLFRRERLVSVGGYNPAERIGQDSLLMRLLRLTGPLAQTTFPTYHRVKRPGALTTSPATKFGSPARQEMRERNRDVFDHCARLRVPAWIRTYRESIVPPELAAELAEHVERLSDRLGQKAAA